MARWVLSACAIKPLPQIFPRPRNGFISANTANPSPSIIRFLQSNKKLTSLNLPSTTYKRNLVLKVSATSHAASVDEDERGERVIGVSFNEDEAQFDPAASPPFTLADIRAAIPKHCWVKDPWTSMSYAVRDVVTIFCLAAAAAHLNNWLVWPLYWVVQGTMFFSLFCIGHDCGHGSFSNNPKLNNVVGNFADSLILMPYTGWRISHRTHHQNHGHADKDESWAPVRETEYKNLPVVDRTLLYKFPYPLFVWPLYIFGLNAPNGASHFDPSSNHFVPNDRKDVITSSVGCAAMLALLVGLSCVLGPMQILKLYGIPFVVYNMWLDMMSYLHHHGPQVDFPRYRGKEWSYLRGALLTLDRDYGWFSNLQHDLGTHIVHHLFPQIPHYHLVEATKAVKPVLGKYYIEPKKSGPLPFHLIGEYIRSLNKDHYVSETGDVVYFQTDPTLSGSTNSK